MKGGRQAVRPQSVSGGISGVVWRDFKPGGGKPGKVEQDEVGIPGVTLDLLDQSGKQVATATSRADGTFAFDRLSQGTYKVGIASSTFQQPYAGVPWLGAEPDHAVHHHLLHLGVGRVRDGRHRRRPGLDPA